MSGSQKGSRTRLHDGFVIGRRDGDLTIRDSKLSSKHARVEARPDGSFWLIDMGSANGIKTPSGERIRELELEPGIIFTLGRTQLTVVTTENLSFSDSDEAVTSIMTDTVTRTYWDSIRELAEKALKKTQSELPALRKEIAAFSPVVRLRFTQGLQTGTEWILGYGPRMVGSGSIDLHLEDASLPAICFRLIPEDEGTSVRFKNESDRAVKLNGAWVEEATLNSGDMIDIMTTQIQVVFDEES